VSQAPDPEFYIADLSDPSFATRRVDLNGLWRNTSPFGLLDSSLNFGIPQDLTTEFVDMTFALFTEGKDIFAIQSYVDSLNAALREGGCIVWMPHGFNIDNPLPLNDPNTYFIDFDPSPPTTMYRGQDRVLWKVLGLNTDFDGVPVTIKRRRRIRTSRLMGQVNLLTNSTWLEDHDDNGVPDGCVWSDPTDIAGRHAVGNHSGYRFNTSVIITPERFFYEDVPLTGFTGMFFMTYSAEFAMMSTDGAPPTWGVQIQFLDLGGSVIDTARTAGSGVNIDPTVGFERLSATLFSLGSARTARVGFYFASSEYTAVDFWARFPQLERNSLATPYRVGIQTVSNDSTLDNGKHAWVYNPGSAVARVQSRILGDSDSNLAYAWMSRRSGYRNSQELANLWLCGRVQDADALYDDTTGSVVDLDATGDLAAQTSFQNNQLRHRWRVNINPSDTTTVEGPFSLFLSLRGDAGGSHGQDGGVTLKGMDIGGVHGNSIPQKRFAGYDIVMIELYPRDSALNGGTWTLRCYQSAKAAGVPIIGFYAGGKTPRWSVGGTAAARDAMEFALGDPGLSALQHYPFAFDLHRFTNPGTGLPYTYTWQNAEVAAAQADGLKVGSKGPDSDFTSGTQEWKWIQKWGIEDPGGSGCYRKGTAPTVNTDYVLWEDADWLNMGPPGHACDGLGQHNQSAGTLDIPGFLAITTDADEGEGSEGRTYRVKVRFGNGNVDALPYSTDETIIDLTDQVDSEYQIVEIGTVACPPDADGIYLECWANSVLGDGSLFWDQWWLVPLAEGKKLLATLPGESEQNAPFFFKGKDLESAPSAADSAAVIGDVVGDDMVLNARHESAAWTPIGGVVLQSGVQHTLTAECTVFNPLEKMNWKLGEFRLFNMTSNLQEKMMVVRSVDNDRWSNSTYRIKFTPNPGDLYMAYVIMTASATNGNIHVHSLQDDYTPPLEGGVQEMDMDGDVEQAYVSAAGVRSSYLIMNGPFFDANPGMNLVPIILGDLEGQGSPFPKHVADRTATVTFNVFPAYE
jgi:hypothetical protein